MVRDQVRDAEKLSVYRPTNMGHPREGDSKAVGRVSPLRGGGMGAAGSGNGDGVAVVEAMNDRMMMRLEQQVCVKRDLVCVKRDLICVKRDLVCVKRDLVCVKRDLLCVKRDLVCVKRDLVCVTRPEANTVRYTYPPPYMSCTCPPPQERFTGPCAS